ncbi:MAG: hypothetical protein H6719_32305 [Sandaracinaceae bacterium]|nr:hypothetical protein [Sandaracinaceae bacterium]
MKRTGFLAVIAALAVLPGCDERVGIDAGLMGTDSGVGLMDGGGGMDDAGPGTDSGSPGDDAGGGNDAGGGADAGTDACVAATACGAFDCGTVDDGCGGTLECGDCGIGAACADDADCASGTCLDESESGWFGGHCSMECYVDADCGTGFHCAFALGNLARIGVCMVTCGTDMDCRGPEYTCYQADMDGARECAPVGVGTGTTGDPCATNADCAGGEDYICLREGRGYRGGMCSESCLVDGDCGTGNHCAFVPATGGEGVCLPTCTTDTDCRADGYVCQNADEDAGAVNECFPGATGTGAIGAPCDGVWDCAGGENGSCFTADLLDGYCTILGCIADTDCGAGSHCSSFNDGAGGIIGVCQPDCTTDADCRPMGYACTDVDDDLVTECYRGGTGAGAVGDACEGTHECAGGARGLCAMRPNNDFEEGYCILLDCTADGSTPCPTGSHCSIGIDATTGLPRATGICADDCTADTDCRATGYRCYDTADVDGFTECWPAATGAGAPGDRCRNITDCAGDEFGICLLDLNNTGGIPDFPGGYCTTACGDVGDPACAAGSTCRGGVCLRDCTMGSMCRPGADYSCVMAPLGGAAGMSCWPS